MLFVHVVNFDRYRTVLQEAKKNCKLIPVSTFYCTKYYIVNKKKQLEPTRTCSKGHAVYMYIVNCKCVISGISAMALGMMVAYNSERAVVWNTYQCYLKQAEHNVTHQLSLVKAAGRCFGAKIVRDTTKEVPE